MQEEVLQRQMFIVVCRESFRRHFETGDTHFNHRVALMSPSMDERHIHGDKKCYCCYTAPVWRRVGLLRQTRI